MAVLLIAEHNNKELRPFTLNAATAASQIDSEVHAVIIGHDTAEVAKQLSELPVVKKILNVIISIFFLLILVFVCSSLLLIFIG